MLNHIEIWKLSGAPPVRWWSIQSFFPSSDAVRDARIARVSLQKLQSRIRVGPEWDVSATTPGEGTGTAARWSAVHGLQQFTPP